MTFLPLSYKNNSLSSGKAEEATSSRSTAYRNAAKRRNENADDERSEFQTQIQIHRPLLVAHWDEVKLKNTTMDNIKAVLANRFPIVVSGSINETLFSHLLEIRKIKSGNIFEWIFSDSLFILSSKEL